MSVIPASANMQTDTGPILRRARAHLACVSLCGHATFDHRRVRSGGCRVISLQRWIFVAFGPSSLVLFARCRRSECERRATGAAGRRACVRVSREQGLTYICELVVPEDILTVGSTGFLLASGHRAPGRSVPDRPSDTDAVGAHPRPYFRFAARHACISRLSGAAESPGVRYARPESRRDVAPTL